MFYRKALLRPYEREALRLQHKPPGADRTQKLKIRRCIVCSHTWGAATGVSVWCLLAGGAILTGEGETEARASPAVLTVGAGEALSALTHVRVDQVHASCTCGDKRRPEVRQCHRSLCGEPQGGIFLCHHNSLVC